MSESTCPMCGSFCDDMEPSESYPVMVPSLCPSCSFKVQKKLRDYPKSADYDYNLFLLDLLRDVHNGSGEWAAAAKEAKKVCKKVDEYRREIQEFVDELIDGSK